MAAARANPTAESGAAAEDAALAHLRAAGLQLLARNVRYPFGEIDLVMREGGILGGDTGASRGCRASRPPDIVAVLVSARRCHHAAAPAGPARVGHGRR